MPIAPPGTLVVDDIEVGTGVAQLGVDEGALVPAAAVLPVVGLDVDAPEAERVGVGVHSGSRADKDGEAAGGVVPAVLVCPANGVPVPVVLVPVADDGAAAGVVPSALVPAAPGVRVPLAPVAGVPVPLDPAPGVVEPTSAGPGVLVPISPKVGMTIPTADVGAREGAPPVALPVFDPEAQPAATKAMIRIAATAKTDLIFVPLELSSLADDDSALYAQWVQLAIMSQES